jgi:RNA polymerase sigma-70 factor, ECF subfamily
MVGPSFTAVLDAAAAGDEAAFRVLWRDLQPRLLRYLDALAPGAGEDLASETWLRVVDGLTRFSGDERAFRAWVFMVARHRAVDRWRRRTRRHDELVPVEALADLPAVDDPAEAALDAISTQSAVALLATLPRDQAEVVLLRVVAASTSPRSPPSPANAPARSGSSPTALSAASPSGWTRMSGSGGAV